MRLFAAGAVGLLLVSTPGSAAPELPFAIYPDHAGNRYAQIGKTLISIPDVDGDGIRDLVFTATSSTFAAGDHDLWVASGKTGLLLFGFNKPTTSQQFGTSIASVPDVNGDGVADLVVGAYDVTVNGTSAGRAYLFSGADGTLIRPLDSTNPVGGGQFGFSVAGLPDIDGDGIGDVAVGAPMERVGSPRPGVVYLFNGASGEFIRALTSPNAVGNGKFGVSVTVLQSATDPPLLAIGAPGEVVPGGTIAGRVHVFDATTGAYIFPVLSPTPTSNGAFGTGVASMKDRDGDPASRDELLVYASIEPVNGAISAGRVHLFSGVSGSLFFSLVSPTPQAGGAFGTAMTATDDIDGDGVADIFIGAPKEDRPLVDQGAAYCFSGASGQLIRTLIPPPAAPNLLFGSAITVLRAFPPYGSFCISSPTVGITSSVVPSFFFYVRADCDVNYIADDEEIAEGLDTDCDLDGIPDYCTMRGFVMDCNHNGIADYCDIKTGTSADANHDGIPDECPTDCLVSNDCNGDQIPDSQQLVGNDCDSNQVPDDCQLHAPFMTRVAANAEGDPPNATTLSPAMTPDHRFILFTSAATNLLSGVDNGVRHLYRKDFVTGELRCIDRFPNGVPADTAVSDEEHDITPDGRFVVYRSSAALVGMQTPANGAVFLLDGADGHTELISRSAAGEVPNDTTVCPRISADGRYVAYVSKASNLVVGDTNGSADVFRFDRVTGTTELVSRGWRGEPADSMSEFDEFLPSHEVTGGTMIAISANGQYVAFESFAGNLAPSAYFNGHNVFVRDCVRGMTQCVSVDGNGKPGGYVHYNTGWLYSSGVDISADGRFVAFESSSPTLDPSESDGVRQDLFVFDRLNQSIRRLQINGDSTNLFMGYPSFSRDCCHIGFQTNLQHVVPGQSEGSIYDFNVFRYDLRDDSIDLISRNSYGVGANDASGTWGPPQLSDDGNWACFFSYATNLLQTPEAIRGQVYLCYLPGRTDCNSNGLIDTCEPPATDCNANGIPDRCECACAGDANGDRALDGRDVPNFVTCLLGGCAANGCACADMNGDGSVGLEDSAGFAAAIAASANAQCP